MPHWLAHVLGEDNASGAWYLFWSGWGGDLAIIAAFLSAPAIYLRHHNCHTRPCWRLGHPDAAGVVKCRIHREKGSDG